MTGSHFIGAGIPVKLDEPFYPQAIGFFRSVGQTARADEHRHPVHEAS